MTEATVKSLITFKVLFVLLGVVAISAGVFAGITQTQLRVETPRKAFAKEAELKQNKALESKVGIRRSTQNLSPSNAINRPVDDVQLVRPCNREFSSCPILDNSAWSDESK
ncbi:MAG: hypothetical protein RBJ76_15845 [Stenomitos frigidus ULC029]